MQLLDLDEPCQSPGKIDEKKSVAIVRDLKFFSVAICSKKKHSGGWTPSVVIPATSFIAHQFSLQLEKQRPVTIHEDGPEQHK